MNDVFVVSMARTPVGKRNGYLREWKAPELLGAVIDEVIDRVVLDPAVVEQVINGTVYQVGEQGFNLARMAIFASKLPDSVAGISCNMQCGSSLMAIQMGYAMIATGMADVLIASGCELMSKYPIMSDADGTLANGKPMGNPFGKFYVERVRGTVYTQMQAAQAIAEKWGISRRACEEFAVASHKKAGRATDNGYFVKEIMHVSGVDGEGRAIVRDTDETIRPETSVEQLETLKPVPGTEWITAGISSPVTDGASAVLLMSEKKMKELNMKPLARIAANAVVGSDPVLMLTGPIPATRDVLKKSGLSIGDIDIYEVNEAFAPIPLAWAKELDADIEKLNVNGGAMALGHPVGNSGCRISITAINELERRGGRYALATLCTGGALGPATIYERA